MVSRTIFAVVLLSFAFNFSFGQNQAYLEYIDQYKAVAVSEMDRTGIPASIKMAQALLESNAGQSDLARKANNHFGIKCGDNWNGKTYKKVDDERNAIGIPKKSCFREYNSAQESFIAHSEFLQKDRYSDLFNLKSDDYKGWAKGLKKAGYATSNSYPKKLIDLIEQYDLDELDHMTVSGVVAGTGEKKRREKEEKEEAKKELREEVKTIAEDDPSVATVKTLVHNDARCLVSSHDIPVGELARLGNAHIEDLFKYNEHLKSQDQLVEAGSKIYVQPKRASYRGREVWHEVRTGETMMYISNHYGVDLERLHTRNRMQPGEEPVPGSRIKLRGGNVDQKPRVSASDYDQGEERPGNDPSRMDIEVEAGGARNQSGAYRPEPSNDEDYVFEEPVPARPKTDTPAGVAVQNTQPVNGGDGSGDPFGPARVAADQVSTPQYHTVQSGDTLWSISQRHRTTVDEIKKLNRLSSNDIQTGMKLRVK